MASASKHPMFKDSAEPDDLRPLRGLVDLLPSMLAYWDRDLRCQFANLAYKKWLGVEADRVIGTHLKDLLGPELFALNEPFIRGALAGQAQQFERVVPGPDGVQRPGLAFYQPYLVGGQVTGFLVQVTDVCVLKRTEAALREEIAAREQANAQLQSAHRSLAEAQRLGRIGSWEWDVAADRTTWSDELFRLFGLDPSRPAPSLTDHLNRYSAESWTLLRAAVSQALATGEPYVLDLAYRRVDGSGGWFEARGEAVRGVDGRVCKLRGTVMDITERRAASESQIQRDLAEQANRNKSVFLSRVSHELRTPLNGILGAAQVITQQEGADSRPGRWATIIHRCGCDMASLVDELLDLSAIELGRLRLNRAAVDLATLVHESLSTHATLAATARVELRSDCLEDRPALALGDPVRLRQVVNHLISNAIQYNRAGGQVGISVRSIASGLELRVEDTGVGLSQAQLAQLFIPFNRLGAERTAAPGSGIGLALTKQLVELMGGKIQVESRQGLGTCVKVTLLAATGD